MGMPDIVNDIYPVFQRVFNFTSNGSTAVGFPMTEFRNGFFIMWGAPDFNYADGDYTLTLEESDDGGTSGTPIPSDRIYFPRVIEQANMPNPLFIDTSTRGLFDLTTGIARMAAVRDFKSDALRYVVTGANVTSGARIITQVFASLQLSPTQLSQI